MPSEGKAPAKPLCLLDLRWSVTQSGSLATLQEYEPPSGELKKALDSQFGGLEAFKGKFNPTAAALQVQLVLALAIKDCRQ